MVHLRLFFEAFKYRANQKFQLLYFSGGRSKANFSRLSFKCLTDTIRATKVFFVVCNSVIWKVSLNEKKLVLV